MGQFDFFQRGEHEKRELRSPDSYRDPPRKLTFLMFSAVNFSN